MVAMGYGLYDLGRYRAGHDEAEAMRTIDELEEEIRELLERNALLVEQNAVLDRASRIDRNAHEEVKQALHIAQQQSLELREELAFFKSLVSPSEMEPGLQIQDFFLLARFFLFLGLGITPNLSSPFEMIRTISSASSSNRG